MSARGRTLARALTLTLTLHTPAQSFTHARVRICARTQLGSVADEVKEELKPHLEDGGGRKSAAKVMCAQNLKTPKTQNPKLKLQNNPPTRTPR